MTPKIADFLRTEQPATPCLVLDLAQVEANFTDMRAAFPAAGIYYAVKANPAPPVMELLVRLGSCFDAASWEEIALCLAAGAPPARISFGNTIKKAASIRQAAAAGIDLFVFDCEEELEKIAANAPGTRVFCRLAVQTGGSVFPLARKFGTSTAMARALMNRAQTLGLVPYGVSFHAGSQQTDPDAYASAIGQVATLFAELASDGVHLAMLNVGGGFPARYQQDIPPIARFATRIGAAMEAHFGKTPPTLLLEPGRYMVGNAGVVSTEVVLVSQRARPEKLRWVYLDIGRFGGLAETENEATQYAFTTPHDGTEAGPVVIAGPTCDSLDTLYEKAGYTMPWALKAGDRVEILATGAYVTTYASTGFNGFKPLAEFYI